MARSLAIQMLASLTGGCVGMPVMALVGAKETHLVARHQILGFAQV